MLIKGHVCIRWLESHSCGAYPVLGAVEDGVKYKTRYLSSRNPEARNTQLLYQSKHKHQTHSREWLEGPKETSFDWQDAGLLLLVSEQVGEHRAVEPACLHTHPTPLSVATGQECKSHRHSIFSPVELSS